MPEPQTNAEPSPEEIDPLETSDLGKDKPDHPPIPYNGPVGGMGADADTAPQPATAGMGADAETATGVAAPDSQGSPADGAD